MAQRIFLIDRRQSMPPSAMYALAFSKAKEAALSKAFSVLALSNCRRFKIFPFSSWLR
ncbi:hypothetical protein LJR084_007642 [Variovorax sp. LjRoot84]|uniref:hypothetical protein n=1 Tax=unclassified Variovorax TaxID=663243 RepID=UPI003ED105D5